MNSISMHDPYLEKIKKIILDIIDTAPVDVFLFGSRASGSAWDGSDVDVALSSNREIRPGLLAAIRENLENSTIPYKVDLVDLDWVPSGFKTKVIKEGLIWKKAG